MPRWLNKLEYKFRRFGIDNLMLYVTGTMLAVYLAENLMSLPVSSYLTLERAKVFSGQIWRLITFIFVPQQGQMIIWMLLWLYFYYFIGSTLENTWGRTRFTLFYAFGVLGAIIAAMITGYGSNVYLNLSMFLAFAALEPDRQILLFFVIPIKIKFLAYVYVLMTALAFIFGGWSARVSILFSLCNVFLFFSDDFINRLKNWKQYGKQRRNFRKTMRRQRDIYGD